MTKPELEDLKMRLTALRAVIENTEEKIGTHTLKELIDTTQEQINALSKATNPFENLPSGFPIHFTVNPFMKEGAAILMVHPENLPDEIKLHKGEKVISIT